MGTTLPDLADSGTVGISEVCSQQYRRKHANLLMLDHPLSRQPPSERGKFHELMRAECVERGFSAVRGCMPDSRLDMVPARPLSISAVSGVLDMLWMV